MKIENIWRFIRTGIQKVDSLIDDEQKFSLNRNHPS